MAPVRTILSGREFSLSFDTGVDPFVDLYSVDTVTGAVTSSWVPDEWIPFMEEAVQKLNAVVPPLDRTALSYLGRLSKIAPMDDCTLTASAITAGSIQTFRVTPFGGVQPSVLLVQLPHSITGFFGTSDLATGLAPPTILGGDVIGPSDANALVAFGPGAGVYGDSTHIPVVTLDAKGRVQNIVPTLITTPASAVFGSYSLNAASTTIPVAPLAPLAVPFDTVEGESGVSLAAGTKLTVSKTGVYSVSFSPEILHKGGTASDISMWLRLNGTAPVPRSNSNILLANNNDTMYTFITIVLRLTAGDFVEWMMQSSNAGPTTLVTIAGAGVGADARPAAPAAIASIRFNGI